ncbi:MAG: DUF1659 domain-containing protein [Clostridium sp.]|uniref:DUF1659 domain-containing protein n=1 Tax=Clostridium sp. TaxID=1506 RepID=UPI003F2FE1A9
MIKKIIEKAELKVSYAKGTDDKGNDIIKSQSFRGINVESAPEEIHGFASLIEGLLNYEVTGFSLDEDYDLVEQAA